MDGGEAVSWMRTKRAQPLRKVLDTVGAECRSIAARFGFSHFYVTIRTMAPPGLPVQLAVDGAPNGFHDLFTMHLDRPDSPALKRSLARVLPLSLSEVADLGVAEPQEMMSRCSALGIAGGIVIPLHGPRSSHGLLMLMGSAAEAGPRAQEDLLQRAQWLSLLMFSRAIDEVAACCQKNKRTQLTTRQRRAICLAANGKVLSEIADSMEVHPSTARYLVTRATEKLGVETRIEAILRAAALGDFEPGWMPTGLHGSSICVQVPAHAVGGR